MKLYQLKQRFFLGGAHMPKFPAWKEPTTHVQVHRSAPIFSYIGHSDPTFSVEPFGFAHKELLGGKEDLDGNLGKAMYQFFVGHPMGTSKFSQCRTCLEVLTPESRKDHSEKYGCYSILVKLLKELPKDECVICGNWTCSYTWNVPLCTPACRELWKFEVCQPGVLLAGIGRALREKVDAAHK